LALPKSAHLGAKKALPEIYNAENKTEAVKAAKAFAANYSAKWPKAVAKIIDDRDVLLAFYDYPALRHEAPHYRAEVKDLRHPAVAAA
jgi:putative transposase